MGPCKYRALVERYLEGDLDADELKRLEEHCASCPQCAGDLAAIRRLEEALPAAYAATDAVETAGGITGLLPPRGTLVPPRTTLRSRRLWAPVAAAAACLLLAVGGVLGWGLAARRAGTGTAVHESPVLALRPVSLEGTVLVRRAGSGRWEALASDGRFHLGDVIQTLPRAGLVLSLAPDCTLSIAPGTTILLKAFNGETEIGLEYGTLEASLEGPHAPFLVSTPDGRVRALGTVFRVSVE